MRLLLLSCSSPSSPFSLDSPLSRPEASTLEQFSCCFFGRIPGRRWPFSFLLLCFLFISIITCAIVIDSFFAVPVLPSTSLRRKHFNCKLLLHEKLSTRCQRCRDEQTTVSVLQSSVCCFPELLLPSLHEVLSALGTFLSETAQQRSTLYIFPLISHHLISSCFFPASLQSHDLESRNILLCVCKFISFQFRPLTSSAIYTEFIFAETCIPRWVHRQQRHWGVGKGGHSGHHPGSLSLPSYHLRIPWYGATYPSACVSVCVRVCVGGGRHVTHFLPRSRRLCLLTETCRSLSVFPGNQHVFPSPGRVIHSAPVPSSFAPASSRWY